MTFGVPGGMLMAVSFAPRTKSVPHAKSARASMLGEQADEHMQVARVPTHGRASTTQCRRIDEDDQ